MQGSSQATLLMDDSAPWERDFLSRELLPESTRLLPLDAGEASQLAGRDRSHGLIIAFSSNTQPFEKMASLCAHLRPEILVHLSDEYYPGARAIYNDLAAHASLYLRQYRLPNYQYPHNTAFLGLGYGSGMLEPWERCDSLPIKPIQERSITWAFVGTLKQDRRNMLETFKALPGGKMVINGIPIRAMRAIYEDCIFAPIGRGNATLDCFRIYESIMTGSIPVVVGSSPMILETLCHLGRPPYILAGSWPAALGRCRTLLQDQAQLEDLQSACLSYWRRHVSQIRDLCSFHLRPDPSEAHLLSAVHPTSP